jgi:hypothetical protein
MEGEENKLLMNGQEVKLKNPGMEGMVDFLKIAKDMSKADEKSDGGDFMQNLTNDSIEGIVNLINLTLRKSFPDMWKNKHEELDQWAMENNTVLMGKVIEMCSSKDHEAKKKQDVHAKVKALQRG